MKTLATEIAMAVDARLNCIKSGNDVWKDRWTRRLDDLTRNHLPSGSGWDLGTKLDLTRSTGEKLIFTGAYHHMNDGGMYDGWTHHDVIVTPSLRFGFDVRVTGRNRNEIKDYLGDLFLEALRATAPPPSALGPHHPKINAGG